MSKRKITKDTNSYCSKSPKWTLDSIFSKITTQLGEETEDTSDAELNIDVPKFSEDSHECKSETGNNNKKDSIKSIIKTNKCMVNVSKSGRSRYVCELCFKFKDTIAKTMSYRGKIPAICTANGTILRLSELQEHLSSEIHKKSCSAENVSKMSNVEKTTKTEIGMCISNQNAALCNRIGSLMIEVFNNCKRGTISAWSWPSIHISNTMSSEFDMGSPHVTYNPSPGIFSYVTPMQHADLLSYIVSGHKPELLTKIKSALAVSLAIDGSVDRFQLDNKYVKCKIITSEGEQEDLFLGFSESTERKTKGYVSAVKEAVSFTITWKDLFDNITCIVTDGESLNIGEHNSLWKVLQDERSYSTSNPTLPLIKIWCAAHRSDLAFGKVSKTVKEVNLLISDACGLSTFFHTSAVRTKELEMTASHHDLKVKHIPKYLEVRWTEFSYSLFSSILFSWQAIVKYLQHTEDRSAQGHIKFLTDRTKFRTMCCVADVLQIYSRFQKAIQDNRVTYFDWDTRVVI